MSGIISRSVRSIKEDLGALVPPEMVLEACRRFGHAWRCRKLDPVTTAHLFIRQVLGGNAPCTQVRQFGGFRFAASAYCQARMRLPLPVLVHVVEQVAHRVMEQVGPCDRWRGHRLLGIDGSSFSMSDTQPLEALFGTPPQQAPGCGFPSGRFVALFGLRSGALSGLMVHTTRSAELPICDRLCRRLRKGDVLVGDRAYCSYAHLAALRERGVHGVFRLHQSRRQGEVVERRSRDDCIMRWRRPRQRPRWMSERRYAALPESLEVRLVRYRIARKGFRTRTVTVATTLVGEAYPAEEIAELYGDRWAVETNLRHLKSTMGMETLRCRTVEGVLREMAVFAIVYNAVRLLMVAAGHRQKVPPDRISFVDALRFLSLGMSWEELPDFVVNPRRTRRSEPRVIKRRHKSYAYMTRPRHTEGAPAKC